VAALLEHREGVVDPVDAVPDGREIPPRVRAGHQVLFDGQVFEDPPSLEDLGHAVLDDIGGGKPVEALAVELDGAFGHLPALAVQEARYRFQGRGLAGAVGAEEGRDAALLGEQRNALQHQNHAVIDDLDVIQREHWDLIVTPAKAGVQGPGYSS
jgi:hypothetical protein